VPIAITKRYTTMGMVKSSPTNPKPVDEDQGDHPERGYIGEDHADEQVDGGDERTE